MLVENSLFSCLSSCIATFPTNIDVNLASGGGLLLLLVVSNLEDLFIWVSAVFDCALLLRLLFLLKLRETLF